MGRPAEQWPLCLPGEAPNGRSRSINVCEWASPAPGGGGEGVVIGSTGGGKVNIQTGAHTGSETQTPRQCNFSVDHFPKLPNPIY